MLICTICNSSIVYDSFGKRIEDGETILAAYLDKSKAIQKIDELNKSIEIEEGDIPYYLGYLHVRE